MKRLLTSLFVVHALACSLMAQTKTVLKTPATNALTESLVVPSGKTLTIASGATINATGATVTGFTASAAWADITGKPSTFPPEAHTQAISTITGLQDAIDAKAATSALSSYLPLTGGTLTGSLTGTSFVSAGTIFPTRTITITGGQSLTWNDTNGTGFSVTVRPDSPSANQIVNFNPNGNIVTTADTGRVTSTMILDGTIAADDIADSAITNAKLAGAIALSKLSTTGTASSSTYLRGDGAWSSVSSDAATADRTAANPTDWTFRWNAVTTTGTSGSGGSSGSPHSINVTSGATASSRGIAIVPTTNTSTFLGPAAGDYRYADFSRRTTIGVALGMVQATSNGTTWVKCAQSASTAGDIIARGFQLKIANLTLTAATHNGTSLSSSSTLATLTTSSARYFVLQSDAAGNVAVYLDGTLVTTLTGGPTSATTNSLEIAVECTNGADAATQRVQVSPVKVIVAP